MIRIETKYEEVIELENLKTIKIDYWLEKVLCQRGYDFSDIETITVVPHFGIERKCKA